MLLTDPGDALGHASGNVVEVGGGAPNYRAKADQRIVAAAPASAWATTGISSAPGTQATSTSSSATPSGEGRPARRPAAGS